MATWSITPNTASIDGNGLATIPKNTSDSAIVYTITYNDGNGGSGQGTYVVNPCPTPTCDDTTRTDYEFNNFNTSLDYNEVSTFLIATSKKQDNPFDPAPDPDRSKLTLKEAIPEGSWFGGFSSGVYNPWAYAYALSASSNTTTELRSGSVILVSPEGCEFEATFTQEGTPTTGCTKMFEVNSHYSILMLYANDYVDEMPSVLYATTTDAPLIDTELGSIHEDGYVGFNLEADEFRYSRKIFRLKDNNGNVEFVEENITKHYGDANDEFVLVYIESYRWDSTLNKYVINVATHDVYTPSFSDCGQEPDCQVNAREFGYNLSWPSTVTAGTTTWELTLDGAIVATANEPYNCDNQVGYYNFSFSIHNTIGDKSKTSGYIANVAPFDSITGETYETTVQGSINRDKNMPSSQAYITNINAPENAHLKWNDRTITLVKEGEEISSNECYITYKEQSASAGFELHISIQVFQTAVYYNAVLYE